MRKNGFFAMMDRMKYITRWGLMRNTRPESLSEHCFETAVLAHGLAVIGRDVFFDDIDPDKAASCALFHDASEILTGDMPTPLKYAGSSIKKAYKSLEREAERELLTMLPSELEPEYRRLFEMEESESAVYRYVKAADKLSAYIKCLEERKSGSREFLIAEKQTLKAVRDMGLPAADYFIENLLSAYELTLDELRITEE